MRLTGLAAAALLAGSLAAHADTVYTYTGQNFTNVTGSYTTSDKVTGSFTVSQPLGDNLSNYSFTPESFSFTDGVQTITSSNTNLYSFEGFSTDGSGNITHYNVEVISGSSSGYIQMEAEARNGYFDAAVSNSGSAYNSGAGSFTEQTPAPPAVTPEPSGILLLGTGMLGVAGVLKRRFA